MKNYANKKVLIFIIVILATGIRLFASNPQRIEYWYSGPFYTGISSFFRILFGWIPFSIGDILYVTVFIWIIWKIVGLARQFKNRKTTGFPAKSIFFKTVQVLLIVYIIFNILWGLNYDREGIHKQLGIKREKYSKDELLLINGLLLQQVNACKEATLRQHMGYPSSQELFAKTYQVYGNIAEAYPFLKYEHKSVKSSFFGWLGNYLGFSGYYNPFTGEAQVNTTVPEFLQPYVTCHEVAHQLGYAKENEANLAGYIAATASDDSLFMYSAYFDLFMYANTNLYRIDSVASNSYLKNLHPSVKNDIMITRKFYRKFENPVEPFVRWIYGKYLEANDQPSGMMTYSEVVADVIGYYKKYGKIGGR